jgi:hypothetical protein
MAFFIYFFGFSFKREEKRIYFLFDAVFIFFASFLFCLRDEWQSRKMRTGSGQMVVWLCEGLEPQTGNGAFSYYTYTRSEKQTIQPGRRRRRRMSCFEKNFL